MLSAGTILDSLESESIEILRETAATFRKPVMMYSIGKDSSVLLHLAKKAFFPGPIPFPLLHIDTKWKFKEMLSFRDTVVKENNLELIVHSNQDGIDAGVNPFTTGVSEYVGQSMRVFPISDWTEADIWNYIYREKIEVNPLYFAKPRPVVNRGTQLIMVDDDRFPLSESEKPELKTVRFRTLGCYPLTAAVESIASTLTEIVEEVLQVKLSERATRLIDGENEDSMEKKKSEGYF